MSGTPEASPVPLRQERPMLPRDEFCPSGMRKPDAPLRAKLLAAVDSVAHAFETRHAPLDDPLPRPVARVHQVHGGRVRLLPPDPDDWGPFLNTEPRDRPEGDALITDSIGVTVAVSVADCLPILITDPVRAAVAAVHGGWRSLAAGIVESSLATLERRLGADVRRCLVAIGPAIGPCCYEVGEEVIEALARRGLADAGRVPASPPGRRPHCDLAAVAIAAATRYGVPRDQIVDAGLCTRCHSADLWSYRADGEAAGRMLAGIARLR